jgi:hypothetical protein
MMIGGAWSVNVGITTQRDVALPQKKAGLKRARPKVLAT